MPLDLAAGSAQTDLDTKTITVVADVRALAATIDAMQLTDVQVG